MLSNAFENGLRNCQAIDLLATSVKLRRVRRHNGEPTLDRWLVHLRGKRVVFSVVRGLLMDSSREQGRTNMGLFRKGYLVSKIYTADRELADS